MSEDLDAAIFDFANEHFTEEYGVEQVYYSIAYDEIAAVKNVGVPVEKVIEDLRALKVGWKSSAFDSERQSLLLEEENDNLAINALQEGEMRCKRKECRSKKCYFLQVQTRSTDEPATTFVICGECHNKYVASS